MGVQECELSAHEVTNVANRGTEGLISHPKWLTGACSSSSSLLPLAGRSLTNSYPAPFFLYAKVEATGRRAISAEAGAQEAQASLQALTEQAAKADEASGSRDHVRKGKG
eukprot:663540-Pelagomonas_calceolata.AAC.4